MRNVAALSAGSNHDAQPHRGRPDQRRPALARSGSPRLRQCMHSCIPATADGALPAQRSPGAARPGALVFVFPKTKEKKSGADPKREAAAAKPRRPAGDDWRGRLSASRSAGQPAPPIGVRRRHPSRPRTSPRRRVPVRPSASGRRRDVPAWRRTRRRQPASAGLYWRAAPAPVRHRHRRPASARVCNTGT